MKAPVLQPRLPLLREAANTGSSVGITKAHDSRELELGIDLAFHYDRKAVVEAAVDAREIECSVLGNDEPAASVAGEIIRATSSMTTRRSISRTGRGSSSQRRFRGGRRGGEPNRGGSVPGRGRGRDGPGRFLPGSTHRRAVPERAEHHPGFHAHQHVSQALGSERDPLFRAPGPPHRARLGAAQGQTALRHRFPSSPGRPEALTNRRAEIIVTSLGRREFESFRHGRQRGPGSESALPSHPDHDCPSGLLPAVQGRGPGGRIPTTPPTPGKTGRISRLSPMRSCWSRPPTGFGFRGWSFCSISTACRAMRSASPARTSFSGTRTAASIAAGSSPTVDLNLDHVVPLSRGGKSTWDKRGVLLRSLQFPQGRAAAQRGGDAPRQDSGPPAVASLREALAHASPATSPGEISWTSPTGTPSSSTEVRRGPPMLAAAR